MVKNKIYRILTLALLLGAVALGGRAVAQNADTMDVVSYDLRLDVGHERALRLVGDATIEVRLLKPMSCVGLDLAYATIDSLFVEGQRVEDYAYDGATLRVAVGNGQRADTVRVRVCYNTSGHVENYGWGGFHFDNNIYYNLGVAFGDYPHCYGRAWFPCHDSFTDKATYKLHVTSPVGWTTTASGVRDSAFVNDDGSETSHWTIAQPISTYLISVSTGPFHYQRTVTEGLYGNYPTTLAYSQHDSAGVERAFAQLERVVPMFEQCLGPYRWGTIGYTATPQGSMEHANNISLHTSLMACTAQECQNTIAHELSHAWFGNLLTCATSEDMWINEGGASFCEELAAEGVGGKALARRVYEDNLHDVLLNTHHTDGGYIPLYGPSHDLTYGSTVYDKGAAVWHSLRGYMGDSLFYASMRRLFAEHAFGSMDSYQLRDALSAYSGMDLTDFFAFHVFRAGFVDYELCRFEAVEEGGQWSVSVGLRQKTTGSDEGPLPASHRVPVTFFKGHQPIATRTVEFSSRIGTATFLLDEQPDYAIPDYYRALSDAVTEEDTLIAHRTTVEMPLAHYKVSLTSEPTDTVFLHVAHHWCRPDGEGTGDNITNDGILRFANRYWVVSGSLPAGQGGKASFQYNRGISAHLDYSFMPQAASMDSLVLLYRRNCTRPWVLVNTTQMGNSTSGYLTLSSLHLGQYALAIVDLSTLSLPEIQEDEVRIYPNPTSGSFTVERGSLSEKSLLTLCDLQGRTLHQQTLPEPSTQLHLSLPDGLYILTLRDPQSGRTVTREIVFGQK